MKMKTRGDWQNLAVRVPESVILRGSRGNEGVPLTQDSAENAALTPERPMTSVTWASGNRSATVRASWTPPPRKSNFGDEDNLNAETKRLLTDRIADCGGDHPDHRRYRYPEPAARAHCGQSSFSRQR